MSNQEGFANLKPHNRVILHTRIRYIHKPRYFTFKIAVISKTNTKEMKMAQTI